MRRRFFWSMLGTAALALTVVAVVSAVLTRNAAVERTRTEIGRQAGAVASLVEEAVDDRISVRRLLETLRDGAQSGDEPGPRVVALLTAAQRITGGSLVDLGWVSADGKLRLVRNPGLGNALDLDAGLLAGGRDQFFRVRIPDETRALEAVAHPLEVSDQGLTTPVVVVARALDLIDWRQITRGLVVPIAVAALLCAIAARALSRWLGDRLNGLAGAAHRLAAGDLTARAADDGDDEVADLAGSFNMMATRLEEAQTREQEFLMSVGHDLRTPLTTIGGYAEALEEGEPDMTETRRIAGVLSRETSRLRRLVEDLMLLARLEAREFTIRPEPVEAGAHVRETVESYRDRAEAAGVRLETHVSDRGTIVTDPDRLAQIVANLLENALRYTPEAGHVVISLTRPPEGLEVRVADTGPGIEQRDLPRVFERFYVARQYRRLRPEGSGLGLAIVKQLVDAMGGTITVESTLGEGTTFRLTLPPMTDG